MLQKLVTPVCIVLILLVVGGVGWYVVNQRTQYRAKILTAYENWKSTRDTSKKIFSRMHDSTADKKRDFVAYQDIWNKFDPYYPPGVDSRLSEALLADKQVHLEGAEEALGVYRNSSNPMEVFRVLSRYETLSDYSEENVETVFRAIAPELAAQRAD